MEAASRSASLLLKYNYCMSQAVTSCTPILTEPLHACNDDDFLMALLQVSAQTQSHPSLVQRSPPFREPAHTSAHPMAQYAAQTQQVQTALCAEPFPSVSIRAYRHINIHSWLIFNSNHIEQKQLFIQ